MTLLSLFTAQGATPQSIYSKKARIKYTVAPFFKERFSTYSVGLELEGIDISKYSIDQTDIENAKIILASELGLAHVSGKADFCIRFIVGDQQYGSAIRDERLMRKYLNVHVDPFFYIRFLLDMPGKLEVWDKTGNKLLEEILDTYTSHESDLIPVNTEEKAVAEFETIRETTLYNETKNQIISHALAIRKRLSRKLYGESSVSEGWFQSFKKAGKYNLQAYDEWADKAIDALQNTAGDGNTDKIRTSLQGPVQFWLEQYDSVKENTDELNSKKKFVCTYNLAHAYSWMGDTDNTKKFLDACVRVNLEGANGAINYLDQNIRARN